MSAAVGWIRESDTTPEHRKVYALSDRAFRLWHHAICYCSRNLTDGVVPGDLMLTLTRTATPRAIADLLASELIEQVEGEYVIHDFLDYNLSADSVRSRRQGTAERTRRWRSRTKAAASRNGDGVTPSPTVRGDAVTDASQQHVVNAGDAVTSAFVTASHDTVTRTRGEGAVGSSDERLEVQQGNHARASDARASDQAATILTVMWPGVTPPLVENVASMYPTVDIAQAARLAVAWAGDETWNLRGAGATLRAAARKLDAEAKTAGTTSAAADERRANDERRWAAAREIYGEAADGPS